MKRKLFALAALLLLAAHAHATPTLTIYTYPGRQVSSSSVAAGVIVAGGTDGVEAIGALTVGGGWTVSCPYTSPINVQLSNSITNWIPGRPNTLTLYVPPTVPSTYLLPGWSTIPAASCVDCTFAFRGSAVATSASLGFGLGVNFTLLPKAETTFHSQTSFQFCRGGKPVCCTDGCTLP
jgi:hypothetical protein